jgi:hypothetical protein
MMGFASLDPSYNPMTATVANPMTSDVIDFAAPRRDSRSADD